MRRGHAHEKRGFPGGHKPDSMAHDRHLQPEALHGPLGDDLKLMPGHGRVGLIIDPQDRPPLLLPPHHAPEIDHRPGGALRPDSGFLQFLVGK